ncbi:unnamed protein product [Fusarium langsethiae]|nr:unnamed protein product [Fusarium langsethiae]
MVMKMLIEAGANVDLKDGNGRIVLSLAKESSNSATMRLLCGAGSLQRDSHRERRKADEEDFNKRDSYHYHPLIMIDSIRIIELYPDAICIDQTDDQERNQQVAVMGEIYRAASSVIMWLGEEIGAIQTASDLLPRVARAQRTLLQEAGDLLVEEGPAEGGEDPKTLLERMFEEQNATEAFEHLMQRTNIWPPEIFNSHIVADSGPQAEILFEDVVFILHTLEVTDPRDEIFASRGLCQ